MPFISVVALILTVSGCENEPYTIGTLRVLNVRNIDGKVLNTYTYLNNELATFKSVNTANNTTLTSSKYIVEANLLKKIISDSTADSYRLTQPIYLEGKITGDSVFTVAATVKTKVAVRSFEFNSDNKLTRVVTRKWAGDAYTDSDVELEWVNTNVTKLTFHTITGESKVVEKEIVIGYDDKNSVFPDNFLFYYTLSETELYWLSANNPISFRVNGGKEQKRKFSYNKFGYPSNFLNIDGKMHGATYTEVFTKQ